MGIVSDQAITEYSKFLPFLRLRDTVDYTMDHVQSAWCASWLVTGSNFTVPPDSTNNRCLHMYCKNLLSAVKLGSVSQSVERGCECRCIRVTAKCQQIHQNEMQHNFSVAMFTVVHKRALSAAIGPCHRTHHRSCQPLEEEAKEGLTRWPFCWDMVRNSRCCFYFLPQWHFCFSFTHLHTYSYTSGMAVTIRSKWGSVCCSRTPWHVDSRN